MKKFIWFFIIGFFIIFTLFEIISHPQNDEWHNYDDSEIVCRVTGCGKKPLYSDWENRYCTEHIDHITKQTNEYNTSIAKKKTNTEKALTKEEADALRGTGYHGCRPNSSAENIELKAAMNKCVKCGMRSHNGANSLCYECQYNQEYGLD